MAAIQKTESRGFIVNRSSLSDRFDAPYYNMGYDFSGFVKLSSIVKIKGGKRLPFGEEFTTEKTNYRYLRVGDISWDGTLNRENFMFLSFEIFNTLKRYEIVKDELLIAIVGATIGKVSIIDFDTNERIILTENCAKITLRNHGVLPKYLFILLQSKLVQKQINLNYIQTTLPKLGLDRLSSIYIPPIPALDVQHKLVNKFTNAFSQKQQKEAQAKELLASIDTYLLNELGISLSEVNNAQSRRVFLSNFRDVVGLRLDPLFFNNTNKTESEIFENLALRKFMYINKGQSITKEKIKEGEYPVIAGGQSSPYSHSEYNFEGNIITVSASGAYSGFVWYHDNPIFASDCIVLQSKDESSASTHFVYFVLKALQKEIYKLQQGAGQPHVYARDLEKMTIPLPPIDIQKKILGNVLAKRDEIEQLKTSAKAILETAKQEVEKIILGDLK